MVYVYGLHVYISYYRVNHSKNAIVKPQAKHPDTAQREMEQAMRKVMEAQQLIDTAIEPPGINLNIRESYVCMTWVWL